MNPEGRLMLMFLFLLALVYFLLCYKFYGGFLTRVFSLDNSRKTPAEELYDGVDYCPTHPAILIGHHFSSIAGAGPIVGPITAAAWFGWLPAYLWCLLGSVFFGGPHDAGSVIASIRHRGRSVAEVVKCWVGARGRLLFQSFTVLTLVLIVAVFIQLGANSLGVVLRVMDGAPQASVDTPAPVAFAAVVYMGMALLFGLLTYRFRAPVNIVTICMAALGLLAWERISSKSPNLVVVVFSILLMVLGLMMLREALRALKPGSAQPKSGPVSGSEAL